MKRNRNVCVALMSVLMLVLSLFLFFFIYEKENIKENQFIHKSFSGTILDYEELDDSFVVIIDNDSTTTNKMFFINDQTMFANDYTKKLLISKTVGIHITIESEFWSQDTNEMYPATFISSD